MLIPESNIRNMLKAISNGNHVFNEQINIYRNTESYCPVCTFDPILKESTDHNCQTCNGKGTVITEKFWTIPSSVEVEDDFKYDFSKAGKLLRGQIYATIDILEIDDVLNTLPTYDLNNYNRLKDFVGSFDYIKWKGAKYTIERFEPGWLQGHLYEIGLTLSLIGAPQE
jgi:hypothetical protein